MWTSFSLFMSIMWYVGNVKGATISSTLLAYPECTDEHVSIYVRHYMCFLVTNALYQWCSLELVFILVQSTAYFIIIVNTLIVNCYRFSPLRPHDLKSQKVGCLLPKLSGSISTNQFLLPSSTLDAHVKTGAFIGLNNFGTGT